MKFYPQTLIPIQLAETQFLKNCDLHTSKLKIWKYETLTFMAYAIEIIGFVKPIKFSLWRDLLCLKIILSSVYNEIHS